MSRVSRTMGNICLTCGVTAVAVMAFVTAGTLIWVYLL